MSPQEVREIAPPSQANLAASIPPATVSELIPPLWYKKSCGAWGAKLSIAEWEEEDKFKGYRQTNGWIGSDFMHSPQSPVRITGYRSKFTKDCIGTRLTGLVYFNPTAESHAGYCHGGSICAVIDDVIGWCGFLATGKCLPWSGFTAQINTSMKRPVPVHSYFMVRATIIKRERRKVWINAELLNPEGGNGGNDEIVHATGEGLVILKRDGLVE